MYALELTRGSFILLFCFSPSFFFLKKNKNIYLPASLLCLGELGLRRA